MWTGVAAAGVASAGQVYANAQNIRNQNRLFDNQRDLANSAHQREVLDLQRAGLNPILSAQGSGADTPNPHAANIDNPLASFGALVNLRNQTISASAQQVAADAAEKNADSTQWQIYDARSLGYAGFDVGFGKESGFGGKLKKILGFGANGQGKYERVYTIRVNKVTGEAYSVPDNRRITSITPVDVGEVNSAGSTGKPSSSPDKPLVIKVNKSASRKPDYRRDNMLDDEVAPMY